LNYDILLAYELYKIYPDFSFSPDYYWNWFVGNSKNMGAEGGGKDFEKWISWFKNIYWHPKWIWVPYPTEEKVTDSAASKDDFGKKIIYIEVINSKDGFTCVAGEDTRCKNIVAGDRNAVVQYSMNGNINASTDLPNGKAVLLSLSCDSLDIGMTGNKDYCVISEQRQIMFDNLLATFKAISN
jgi:hypothetical protein